MHAHNYRIDNGYYNALYAELSSRKAIPALAKKYNVTENTLEVIYAQKLVRNVRKKFHALNARIHSIARDWRAGTSFTELATAYSFSPVMMASLIMQSFGWSKKKFAKTAASPSSVADARIRCELIEALENDTAFSPAAHAIQKENAGRWENEVGAWLDRKGIGYSTEAENKGAEKTPDFLLKKPFDWNGLQLKWVECKASFGDEEETRRNLAQQLSHYVRLFGPGMVIYYQGTVAQPRTIPEVIVETREVLKK